MPVGLKLLMHVLHGVQIVITEQHVTRHYRCAHASQRQHCAERWGSGIAALWHAWLRQVVLFGNVAARDELIAIIGVTCCELHCLSTLWDRNVEIPPVDPQIVSI